MSLFQRSLAMGALFIASATPVLADDIEDTIKSALDAYRDGDAAYAADELSFALQLLKERQAGDLQSFLPAPRANWIRKNDEDAAAAIGFMGGTGAVAEYKSGSKRFTITLMMDSPMIAGMAAMISNPAVIASSGGKLVRVGREKFASMDGNVTGLVGNRVLIQAEGDDTDAIIDHLETMDLRGLSQFGF